MPKFIINIIFLSLSFCCRPDALVRRLYTYTYIHNYIIKQHYVFRLKCVSMYPKNQTSILAVVCPTIQLVVLIPTVVYYI